ncbi:MAG: RagB/SusD family nutrient uptake outer membrane protein [Prevotella sp.]|nr:RagB/SusD family nutrient uptake outer membrane protein [Prevotella sp.]MBR6189284.1 RagB/SusD family nutrient uptake outer membrane protein [Prevotella sp.]
MKYNNNIKSLLCGSLILLATGTSLTSCKDWLEKDPESIVAEDEAFKNYRNFQGYIEEIYNLIPDKEKVNYCTAWNFGDDAVHNPEGYAHMDHQVDLGNYRNWYSNTQCWLNGDRQSLWRSAWYCIRKCNMGIANIKALVGTDEERDLLLGQMYFFRAWWHFELMCYFGGLPYIDEAFEATSIPELPRLSFQECADRCAEDFERAADLLPLDPQGWDETLAGMQTSVVNYLRVNKFMALCYLGKCYLWAGSPLMKEFEKYNRGETYKLLDASSTGKTYDYDVEYCKKAAETFGRVLEMVNRKQVTYKLADFRYSNIYDHVKDENFETSYSDIFYTVKQGWNVPGSTEAIFRGVCSGLNTANWNCAKIFGPKVAGLVAHDKIIHHPTANVIDQYGMANGQPIYLVRNGQYVLNPESGWDPEHPYKNRDPRFYHDIIFDGFHYVLSTDALNSDQKKLEYCDLYTGGAMRSVADASSTGYFIQKLVPHQCNEGDKWYDWDYNFECYLPYMRLADIYLMYAEAQAVVSNSAKELKDRPTYCSLSAVDAINVLRDRVNSDDYPMEHVQANLMDTKEHFIDEVRRERAVELSFEGFRWCDLQRWLLLTEPPYTVKYSHEFERLEDAEWFKSHDPKDAKVGNFHKEELITRRFESKHYWFPLPDKDIYLYEGFPQNPGW